MPPAIIVDSTASLEAAFHRLIPLSVAMGLQVVEYTGDSLGLRAPLANNINHQQSAFGGSLFALAALAGWGLMQLKLSERQLDCNTVIADAEVSFQQPIVGDLLCHCSLPEDAASFFDTLTRTGKASLTMSSSFEHDGEMAMRLLGTYLVKKNHEPKT